MASLNSLIHFFEIENERTTIFLEDMHDFAILTDNDNLQPIHYPTYELAKQESDRLNALGIKDLVTKPIGIPYRIYLRTWQQPRPKKTCESSNEELFHCLLNLKIISPDEKFEEWKDDRARMLEICKEANLI